MTLTNTKSVERSILANQASLHIQQQLSTRGWALVNQYCENLEMFSALLKQYTNQLTFDPARAFIDGVSQKVDAGTAAVGLHIENGNTPFPPKLVAFYSAKSAAKGSQTTICDGVELYEAMPPAMKKQWQRQVTVSRQLPSALWRQYVVDQHPLLDNPEQVSAQHLQDLIKVNARQRGTIDEQDNLHYELDINPCLKVNGSTDSHKLAFANAILGPSFNYQTPEYRFENGEKVSDALIQDTAALAEELTIEHQWQDGDVILIDNHRVMHGRREITVPLSERELFIGMGS
ncbi:TauD/TfdA family dioxygenase [Thalassotalea montiporae]